MLAVALSLVLLGTIKAWHPPSFCHHQPCPEYNVTGKYGDIELRSYVGRTGWLTSQLHGNSSKDLGEAETVLRNYILKDKGYNISTWPLLVVEDSVEAVLSLYVPPDTEFHTEDPRVQMQYIYDPNLFVRPFSGEATIQNAKESALELRKDLKKAGFYDLASDYGAAFYQSFSSPSQYKEVWILLY